MNVSIKCKICPLGSVHLFVWAGHFSSYIIICIFTVTAVQNQPQQHMINPNLLQYNPQNVGGAQQQVYQAQMAIQQQALSMQQFVNTTQVIIFIPIIYFALYLLPSYQRLSFTGTKDKSPWNGLPSPNFDIYLLWFAADL